MTEQQMIYARYQQMRQNAMRAFIHNMQIAQRAAVAGGGATLTLLPDDPEAVLNIHNIEEFCQFADRVNAGETFANQKVSLCKNLDMQSVTNFQPIGCKEKNMAFKGVFDGRMCTISNLMINDKSTTTGVYHGTGLFGKIDSSIDDMPLEKQATVKNLTLKNYSVSGVYKVGGIVGSLHGGSIENCNIVNGTVIQHEVEGTTDGQHAAGIVATANPASTKDYVTNHFHVVNCSFEGNIRATAIQKNGGIVAFVSQVQEKQSFTVEKCVSKGTLKFADLDGWHPAYKIMTAAVIGNTQTHFLTIKDCHTSMKVYFNDDEYFDFPIINSMGTEPYQCFVDRKAQYDDNNSWDYDCGPETQTYHQVLAKPNGIWALSPDIIIHNSI